jgi:hypothetical protein
MICDMLLWAEGVPGGQIHQRMCAQCGDNDLSRRVMYEWIEMFTNDRTSVTDAERSGHPTTATTAQNEERTRELILQNKSDGRRNCKTTEYQHWVCLFCGA